MILVEPSIIHRRVFEEHRQHRQSQLDAGVQWMKKRHQEWKSREEAFSWLRHRTPWNSWDPRVLRKFVVRQQLFLETSTILDLNRCPCRNTAYALFAKAAAVLL